MYLGLFLYAPWERRGSLSDPPDYSLLTIGEELYARSYALAPHPIGYSRQPVTFGAPDGAGWAENTSAVTFGGPPSTPSFDAPFNHPNQWIAFIAGLCTGNVIGVADVIAWALLFGTFGTHPILPGESLAIPPSTLKYKSATQQLSIGDFRKGGATITPARGDDGVDEADPVFDVCYRARWLQWMLQWATWYNTQPLGLLHPVDTTGLSQAYAGASHDALVHGCPSFP